MDAESFKIFYSEYPKHVEKQNAAKLWAKLPDELLPVIMEALRLQKKHNWRDTNKKYICNPARWLRRERWEDEIEYGEDVIIEEDFYHTDAEIDEVLNA